MAINNFVKTAAILARNPGLRSDVQAKLKKLDLTILKSTGHGASVLEEISTNPERIDLIIMDPSLTDVEARDFLTALRGSERGKSIHIFLMYLDAELPALPDLLQFGLSGYIKKPFSGDNLNQMLLSRFGKFWLFKKNFTCLCNDTAANFFEMSEQYAIARKYYDEIVNTVENPQSYFDIGRLYTFQKMKDEAFECFSMAMKLDQNYSKIVSKFIEKNQIKSAKASQVYTIPPQAIKLFNIPAENFSTKFYAMETIQQVVIVGCAHDERVRFKTLLSQLKIKQVQLSDSGAKALPMFKSAKVDLAIIGIHMSDMNGLEFLDRLNSVTDIDSINMVLLLEEDLSANLKPAFNLGISGFVFKPYSLNKVCMSIHTMMVQQHFSILSGPARRHVKACHYFLQLENLDLAYECIETAYQLCPEDAVTLFYFGMVSQKRGEIPRANYFYEQAIAQNHDLEELIKTRQAEIAKEAVEATLALTTQDIATPDEAFADPTEVEVDLTENLDLEIGTIPLLSPAETEAFTDQELSVPAPPAAMIKDFSKEAEKLPEVEVEVDLGDSLISEGVFTAEEPSYRPPIALETGSIINASSVDADELPLLANAPEPSPRSSREEVPNQPMIVPIESAPMPAPMAAPSAPAPTINGPTAKKSPLFNASLIDTINSNIDVEVTPENYNALISPSLFDVIDKKFSGPAKKNAYDKLTMGVTAAHYPLAANIEQVINNEEKNFNLSGGVSVKTIGTEISEWKPTQILNKETDALGKFLLNPNLAANDQNGWNKLADATGNLLSQAKLFNSRILATPEGAKTSVELASFFDSVGRNIGAHPNSDILVAEGVEISSYAQKLLKKVDAGKIDPLIFEKIGENLVKTGYLDQFYTKIEERMAEKLKHGPITPMEAKRFEELKQMSTALAKLRLPAMKLHAEFLKGKEKFNQSLPYVITPDDKGAIPFEPLYRAMEVDHHSLEAFKKIFVQLKGNKQDKMADQFFRENLPKYTQSYSLAHSMAKFMIAVDDLEKAQVIQKELYRMRSNDPEVVRNLVAVAYRRKNYKECAKWSKTLLGLLPQDQEAYNYLGVSHKKLNNMRRSIGWYKKGLKYHPESAKLHYNLAIALANFGKKAESEEALRNHKKFLALEKSKAHLEDDKLDEIKIA